MQSRRCRGRGVDLVHKPRVGEDIDLIALAAHFGAGF
jgi:hypothetical protein